MDNRLIYGGSLHNHTDYSNLRLRDSINKVNDLINYAVELGHSVIAITDHECICNAIKVEKIYKKIKETNPNFKVILGNEIYLVRNGLNAQNFVPGQDRYTHFILLAKDAIGHQQIREISTRAWMRSYMARGMRRVPTYYQDLVDIIGKNKGHVIGATACIGGALGTQLLRYKESNNEILLEKIKIWCNQMEEIFGHENFYLEMQPSANKEQKYVNHKIVELSHELNIPTIITTDSHYLKKSDRSIHKAFLNAQGGEREIDDFYATTYMMNTEELELYMDIGEEELQRAYSSILHIKEMCEDYSLQKPLKIPELKWRPQAEVSNEELAFYIEKMPLLKNFMSSPFKSDNYLVGALINGIKSHNDLQNDKAYEELNNCLSDTWVSSEVNKAQWSAYFLNLQYTLDLCWEAGTLVGPGRGSGVGFLLLYALDIIQINCLRENTKTYRFRFLNPERVSVLDIDTDVSGIKRSQVLTYLRQSYGQDRVANVVTFGTEKSKSAIQTAARGLGIDVDIAQYLSSMIPSDRGQLRTLHEVYYGDEEKGFAANRQFVNEMSNNYPELWEVAQKIEGLICRTGIHAGGVIFVDEPFTNSTALMRAPDGTVCTQFDLHDDEAASLIKIDLLSVEGIDRIQTCLELLLQNNMIKDEGSLRKNYESIIGVYNLERDNSEMWEMLCNHKVNALFQMEGQTGISGIEALAPSSVDDLAILNSTIRLMAQNKGDEMPTDKCARFKRNPQEWDRELAMYGLGKKEKEVLEPILGTSYGLCITQEQFMLLVQQPELGGLDLKWADKLRKSIAKKNPKEYEALTNEYFSIIREKGLDERFCSYVWNVLIAMSRGYGFNASHTLAYSIVALQELNLAYKFPILFWNCACLITDSGGNENEEEEIIEDDDISTIEYFNEMEDFTEDDEDDVVDEYDEDDGCDGYPATIKVLKDGKKKKKVKTTNFGKIATAIGKMNAIGITVAPPDINKSLYTFSPSLEDNEIRYGLSGITRIGEDLIKEIIAQRPYTSLDDFLGKVKANKTQVINLIKCGAFDSFGTSREEIMKAYVELISDQKKRLTLQNCQMLIKYKLLPEDLQFEIKVFNFNKYIKKTKDDYYFYLDEIAFKFYEENFDVGKVIAADGYVGKVPRAYWEGQYDKYMDNIRTYIKKNNVELLTTLNKMLVDEVWDKYCLGNLSHWEMESISCYSHPHELENINVGDYDIEDYSKLPDEPEIDKLIYIKDKKVPLYKISRIAGTILDKNKTKKTITLLTTSGVVTVRIFGDVFSHYDQQISVRELDGHKRVIEKSWLSRGNKIIVCGIKQDNMFSAKKYSRTPYHLIELITDVNDDGSLELRGERVN